MRNTRSLSAFFALACSWALLTAAPVRAQVIRLLPQAAIEPRQDVRLGDIATISGVDARSAEDLANTVILSAIDSSRTIKTESILLFRDI